MENRRKVIADFCFKGPPDATGVVEIGYETYSEERNKGVMTEALSVITQTISQLKSIRKMNAFTSTINAA